MKTNTMLYIPYNRKDIKYLSVWDNYVREYVPYPYSEILICGLADSDGSLSSATTIPLLIAADTQHCANLFSSVLANFFTDHCDKIYKILFDNIFTHFYLNWRKDFSHIKNASPVLDIHNTGDGGWFYTINFSSWTSRRRKAYNDRHHGLYSHQSARMPTKTMVKYIKPIMRQLFVQIISNVKKEFKKNIV